MARFYKLNKNTKTILSVLLRLGIISAVVLSPMILPAFGIILVENKKAQIREAKEKRVKNFLNTFYQLKKRKLIKIEKRNNQIYISLTEKGKSRAGKYQIDDLKIKRPKKWDKKWRIVIFDISSKKKIVREALRGKLKQLDFFQLQKSVWLHPFDCREEITLLKDFFNLNNNELRVIISDDIDGDAELKGVYKV